MSRPALSRVRGWRRRLTVSVAAGVTLGGGALVAAPLHVAAASTITLTTSSTTANAGTSVTLTATASSPPSSWYIFIYEVTSGDQVGSCWDATTCNGNPVYPTASAHTFRANLVDANGFNLVAQSNTVTVTWVGTATYTATLSASTTQQLGGQPVTLQTTASPNLPTGYHLDIWETTTKSPTATRVADCGPYASSCSQMVTHDSGSFTYQAFLDNDPSPGGQYPPPPTSVIATSAPVTVTWILPSDLYCNPATLPVLGGSDAGIGHDLNIKVGLPQSAVCFRVDAGGGDAVGGALLINTTLGATLPTVVTGNLCGGSGNTAPGPHPIVDPVVLGQPTVFVDTYAGPNSNGATFVCASVAGVADTLIVSATVGALPSVSFVADPDSLVHSIG